MAVYETWTVLKHDPIEKHSDNFWTVHGRMENGTPRVMALAKLRDGRILVHNAIALADDEMREIEAWGTPSMLIVPNAFHRQDAKIYKQRYPSMKVYAPAGGRKGVAKVVPVDGDYDDLALDETVSMKHLDGTKKREGALTVKSGDGASVVLTDVVMNQPKMGGFMGMMLAPTGRPAVPRIARWMIVGDKAAFARQLGQLGATPELRRVIVAHGEALRDAPGAVLTKLAAELSS